MHQWLPYVGVVLALVNGCALVVQGMHQTVRIASNPPASRVTFAGEQLLTPGSVTISRRRGYHVIRAEKSGFVSACKLIECAMNKGAVVFDSIPAAVPLAIDGILGTLHVCPDAVTIDLEAERPGVTYGPLPSDDEIILAIGEADGDLCDLQKGSRVLIFAGEPSRAYEIIGEVTVTETDLGKYGARMTPENLDRVIRKKAIDTYGDKVDALIGTGNTFEGSRLGYSWGTGLHTEGAQGFARGLAVRFTGGAQQAKGTRSLADRLRDLEDALRSGLITREEFDREKARMLDDL